MATITSRRTGEILLDVAPIGKKVRIAYSSFTAEITQNEANILVDKLVDALEEIKAKDQPPPTGKAA